MPALSIIVPTYNRWTRLQTVLEALANQTVPEAEVEIVVVSDGSPDETDAELSAGNSPVPVNFIQQENQGPAVARNTGVAKASGDLILFIDDDVVPEPECAAVHLAAHEKATMPMVIIGPLLTPEDLTLEPWVQWEQNMLYKQYEAMARGDWKPTARQFYTGNASLGREPFLESGGFDPTFLRGEDIELAYRLHDAGMSFDFDFGARAFHHASRGYGSWLSNASAYGRNDAMMWRDGGQSWILPTIRAEFYRRNPFTRLYAEAGLRAPKVGPVAAKAAPSMVAATSRVGLGSVGQRLLSAVYNLAYYQGVVDELGGLDAFRAVRPDGKQGSRNFQRPEPG